MLRPIFAFLEFLFEEVETYQLALSVVLGIFLGLVPFLTLQWWFSFGFVLFFRLNLATTLFSFFTFSILGLAIEPYLNNLGNFFLTGIPRLIPIWAWMYHVPIIPYTGFNNTYVFGSTLIALVLAVPIFFLMFYFIKRYRSNLFHLWKETKLSRYYAYYKRFN